MKRATLFYVATLGLVLAANALVLHSGASLPAPGGAQTVQTAAPGSTPAAGALHSAIGTGLSEPLSRLLLQLLVIIAAARLVGKLFVRLGQPSVVGEMAAGVLLGPSLFGWLMPEAFAAVFPEPSLGVLRLLSQVGVCLFMFTIGMELDVDHLRSRAHTALMVSHVSIVLPYLLGVVLAWFLYSQLAAPGATFTAFALFMGISMSITAFPVLARILRERRMTRTSLGSTALTCAAVGDVTAWCILAFVVGVARATSLQSAAFSLLLAIAFVAFVLIAVRKALDAWLGEARLASETPSESTLAAVVCVVIGAALVAELVGIHALFGSFLAGVIVPDRHGFRHKRDVRVENFSTVFLLPLFFAFTGLRTQLGLLHDAAGWLVCLLIVAVATLGKLGGSALAARFTGMSWSDSLQLGALMNTRGLMELIALNIGYDLGILSPRIFTMLVIMALVTTVLTGPLLTLFAARKPATAEVPEPTRA